jgi:hypothetical protein
MCTCAKGTLMEEKQHLEQIIESDHRVAVLDTKDPLQAVTHFKRLTLTSGRAVYDWSAENGLYRLGIEHIFIPRTRVPVDVLAYITSSRHYGIYLLKSFDDALTKPAVERQLVKLIEKQDGVRRLVFLVGHNIRLPQSIASKAALLRWNAQQEAQLS